MSRLQTLTSDCMGVAGSFSTGSCVCVCICKFWGLWQTDRSMQVMAGHLVWHNEAHVAGNVLQELVALPVLCVDMIDTQSTLAAAISKKGQRFIQTALVISSACIR